MRQEPPAHYRAYWRLEEQEAELYKMAKSILMTYIQSWGQTNFEKTNSLTLVAQKMGYKVKTIPDPERGEDRWAFDFDEKRYPQLIKFIEEVRNISRGNFESETVQIANLIRKYTLPVPWYKKLFK